ncbi:MAG: DUF494 domain-containing protein [Salinisphaera sp.]|nr:DUF494 domain-containing protein [Salinisphaera sp.]
MNEDILDVLLYLFENYPADGLQDDVDLRDGLDEAGFPPEDVDGAFAWLRATHDSEARLIRLPADHSLRLYSPCERDRLPPDCRGYLLRLQRQGILSAQTREIVIDRLLALADDVFDEAIDLEQLKWVTMLVLCSQGADAELARMEATLLTDSAAATH